MSFLNAIIRLLSIIKKDKMVIKKASNNSNSELLVLNPNIGTTNAQCPYCNLALKQLHPRKTKCKNCGNNIYVRTRPADYKKILVKEDELKMVQQEWEKRTYSQAHGALKQKNQTNLSKHRKCSSVIDVSAPASIAIKELIKNSNKFLHYEEILKLNKEDRSKL